MPNAYNASGTVGSNESKIYKHFKLIHFLGYFRTVGNHWIANTMHETKTHQSKSFSSKIYFSTLISCSLLNAEVFEEIIFVKIDYRQLVTISPFCSMFYLQ